MNRRNAIVVGLATAVMSFVSFSAFGQGKSIKQQLEGAWTLVSVESTTKEGKSTPFAEGGNLKGSLIFIGNRFAFQVTSEAPKLASSDRLKTTAEENKAVAHSGISYFGTYTLSDDKNITLQIERSTFPNQNGVSAKRVISITGDELKLTNPASFAGNKNDFVFKRAN